MKSILAVVITLMFLAIFVGLVIVKAQGPVYGTFSVGPLAPSVAACPLGAKYQATFCAVSPGTLYVSWNAKPYVLFHQ